MRYSIVALLPLLFATLTPAQMSSGAVPRIGVIKNTELYGDPGCGCGLSFASEKDFSRKILVSGWGESYGGGKGTSIMNIDGRDIKLNHVSTTTRSPRRHTEKWTTNGLTVQIDWVLRKTGYEAAFHNATITATRGARKQTVKATGGCGC